MRVTKSKLLDMLKVGDLLIRDSKVPHIITEIWEGKNDKKFIKNGYWACGIEEKTFFYDNSTLHSSIENALNGVDEIYRRNNNSRYEIFAYRKKGANNTWHVKELEND